MSDKTSGEGSGQQLRDLDRGKQDTISSTATKQRRSSALGSLSGYLVWDGRGLKRRFRLVVLAAPMMAWGQTPLPQAHDGYLTSQITQEILPKLVPVNRPPECCTDSPSPIGTSSSSSSDGTDDDNLKKDLDSCHSHEVKNLPGSTEFGSHFIEAMATDPDPKANDPNVVWGLTADLSSKVPSQDRAMYISKSVDGGKTWTQMARVDSKYFDAGIGEGERNGLGVSPGGTDFVITTQRGAFQVVPQSGMSDALVRSIAGPRVPRLKPKVTIPKRNGDPVRGNVVLITPDGKNLIIGYGYFDLDPQIFTYHKADDGSWIKDGALPPLPTKLDILSMEFDDRKTQRPSYVYVGTGDQAFRLNFETMKWTRIRGVGADSAVQGISTVGGPHLAACWGIYNPLSADAVKRVTNAKFLLHRDKDQTGPNIRAFSIEVDPWKPNREIVTSLTGVYTSNDSGRSWKRINDLPDGEFRSAHFTSEDGTVIVSGIAGTFIANPFSNACSLHLRTRD